VRGGRGVSDSHRATTVLDASAVIALVFEERGADRVEAAVRRGSLISAVNWTEVLSEMAERGEATAASAVRVKAIAEATGSLAIVPFDELHGVEAARLRTLTKTLGLSLADRACLALGRLRRLPVLTADRAWRSLHLSVRIDVIR
jgi:ribonuclease VapC